MISSLVRRLVMVAGLQTVLAIAASAQDSPTSDPTASINYINAWEHEIGIYGTDQQSIRVLTVPISITVRSLREHPWGIRLRLSGLVAGYGFETLDAGKVSVTGVGFMPGIEFLVPIGTWKMLRPWLDFGAGTDLDSARTVWMTTVGLRSEFIFSWEEFQFGLSPGLTFSADWPHPTRDDDRFLNALLRVDARHSFRATASGHEPDIGPYVEYGYYIDALEFTSISGAPMEQRQRWELGVSVGFRYERPKLWFVRVPRVSLGWRFGDGVNGIRIRVGGDWISPTLAKPIRAPQR